MLQKLTNEIHRIGTGDLLQIAENTYIEILGISLNINLEKPISEPLEVLEQTCIRYSIQTPDEPIGINIEYLHVTLSEFLEYIVKNSKPLE
jgi:hypothetical protein